jgi:hypothetical protein
VVDRLPSKNEALSSNLNTAKKKKEKTVRIGYLTAKGHMVSPICSVGVGRLFLKIL